MSPGGEMPLGSYLKLLVRRSELVIRLVLETEVNEGIPTIPDEEGLANSLLELNATLYPYQKTGVSWLLGITRESLGGILGDEMGLGKTLQIIALFHSEIQQGRTQHLVVAPVTIIENWRREIRRFAPGIKVVAHQGKDRTGFPKNLEGVDVVLTSYDTVVRDLAMFQMIKWGVVVLDEAQAIKTPGTQRTQAVKKLHRTVGIAVTGTPVENRLLDLWSIMDFTLPGHLGTQADFISRFVDSVDDAEELEPLVSPLMLRRRVAEVAKDLPPRVDIPQILELTETESALYEAIRKRTEDEFGQTAALVNLTRLRMFCAHPNLSDEGRDLPPLHSAKLNRLIEILEEVFQQGEKALVFTSYKKMADLIAETIRKVFLANTETLDGRRVISERQPLIDRFTSDPGLRCLVLNPKAAGAGLNITAANHVIHYNPEWNPATEDQATARSYRRGQVRPVTVHRLIYGGTVEEVILDRLERKRNLAEAAVVGAAGDEPDHADIIRALTMSPARNLTQ
jgi:SNF2 family DNA or RNA helicase